MTRNLDRLAAAAALSCAAPGALALQLDQTQSDKLTPTAPAFFDQYGEAVGIEGPWLLVGAPGAAALTAGEVAVYQDTGAGFALQQVLPAPDPAGLAFGRRLAVDGGTAVVVDASTAWVFVLSGATWTLQQELPAAAQSYGNSVAVDGDTIAVGAYGQSDASVYVWTRSGATWSLQQELLSPAGGNDGFGISTALSGDTLIVGARDDDQAATDAGAFFVYQRSGTSWSQSAKVIGPLPFAGRRLGSSAALQDLGGGALELALGATGTSPRVQIFQGAGAVWTATTLLQPSVGGSNSWFGSSLAIEGDRLVVGAQFADAAAVDSGMATFYRRCGAVWVSQGNLVASDGALGDQLGRSVALGAGLAVVGAPGEDDGAQSTGAVYVYDGSTSTLVSFCHADGSSTPCPCGNDLPPGTEGGCLNSLARGGELVLNDKVSVGGDKLEAYACGLIPGQPALLFAGLDALNGGAGFVFGDGLRCAGTGVVRLGTQTPDAIGAASWGPALGALGGWGAGDTRSFQAWYRDPTLGPCASGFNLSNGVTVTFAP